MGSEISRATTRFPTGQPCENAKRLLIYLEGPGTPAVESRSVANETETMLHSLINAFLW